VKILQILCLTLLLSGEYRATELTQQSQSYFTTGGLPPISSSWRQALSLKTSIFFSTEHLRLYPFRNILSEERMGLSFTTAADPRQRTYSRVRARGTHDHILRSPPGTGWPSYTPRHWVPFSSPPASHRATVVVFNPACTRGHTYLAGLGSSLHSLGADPIENTASNSFSVVTGGCLTIARISLTFVCFRGIVFTEPYSETAVCLFAYCIATAVVSFVSRPLSNNGSLRHSI
jgi:hypothetical protein